CSSCHRSEPAAARVIGCATATGRSSVHRVELELRKKRQGRRLKAAAPNKRPNDPIPCIRLLQQNLPNPDSKHARRCAFRRRTSGKCEVLHIVALPPSIA